jgi:hypothetical protein
MQIGQGVRNAGQSVSNAGAGQAVKTCQAWLPMLAHN